MLKRDDKWIWDFWFAQQGADTHVFYLQAPRSLNNPDLRHDHATVGHAVSHDLRTWTVLADALHPGPAGSWDDYTIWTGSVIARREGGWCLLYTGRTRSEQGQVQRIGTAFSDDLLTWHRPVDQPTIEADPRWYERLADGVSHEEAWRDPYVIFDDTDGHYHAFITARANHGPSEGRGVIGHARSPDLITWEVLPPVSAPGDFYHLEVPQYVALDGRHYLLFCTGAEAASPALRARGFQPTTGTHYLAAPARYGPYALERFEFLSGDATGSLYAGRLIQAGDGAWHFMAWHNIGPDGQFIGALADPLPVTVDQAGLRVGGPARHRP